MRLKFIEPCIPTTAKALPIGPGWLFEPKIDGWRIQVAKDGDRVALYTRNGHDIAERLPRLTDALRGLPVRSCHIDGELIADYEDRIGDLWSLQRAMAEGRENRVAVMAFDLLSLDGFDLRGLHLADRKLRLDQLVARGAALCKLRALPGGRRRPIRPHGGAAPRGSGSQTRSSPLPLGPAQGVGEGEMPELAEGESPPVASFRQDLGGTRHGIHF